MRRIFAIAASLLLLVSCEKEIDIDYNEIDPIVVIEGRVTNEGMEVAVRRSRSVNDSVHGLSLPGAEVTIHADGVEEHLAYDKSDGCYRSLVKGVPGNTYRMTVDFEGKHYEASSTMPKLSTIITTGFYWLKVLDERMLVDVMWATDPNADERNYFHYRVDRISSHPHITDKMQQKPYRWNVFDDRGNPPGLVFRDIYCMAERTAEEDEEENWKNIIYEGDKLVLKLMTIDRTAYEYFRALSSGQSGGANPVSNISGGCLGYFMAAGVTHADTITYQHDKVVEYTVPEGLIK